MTRRGFWLAAFGVDEFTTAYSFSKTCLFDVFSASVFGSMRTMAHVSTNMTNGKDRLKEQLDSLTVVNGHVNRVPHSSVGAETVACALIARQTSCQGLDEMPPQQLDRK
nr:unnamed protein product [Spirometra erinaceieuropaei]